jgi:hypothetical protein
MKMSVQSSFVKFSHCRHRVADNSLIQVHFTVLSTPVMLYLSVLCACENKSKNSFVFCNYLVGILTFAGHFFSSQTSRLLKVRTPITLMSKYCLQCIIRNILPCIFSQFLRDMRQMASSGFRRLV